MNRTINYVVGTFVAIAAFGIALYWVPQSLHNQDPIDSLVTNEDFVAPYIIITWETDEPHQGYVYFQDSGTIDGREREPEYRTVHRLRINRTNHVGTTTYHVESCPLKGDCLIEAARTFP